MHVSLSIHHLRVLLYTVSKFRTVQPKSGQLTHILYACVPFANTENTQPQFSVPVQWCTCGVASRVITTQLQYM